MRKQNVSFFKVSYALRHEHAYRNPDIVPTPVARHRLVGQQAHF
jgi:hypothetical protein